MKSELLLDVKTIVTHADCADGIASALILKDALPWEIKILFVQYGTRAHRDLVAEPGTLFCDMTPPAGRHQEFVNAGAILMDHHRGARDLVEAFGERGVFADEHTQPGLSGALLAFHEVWEMMQHTASPGRRYNVREFATLAGIRDTWQRDSDRWREASAQREALLFWPWAKLADIPLTYIINDGMLDIGEVLLTKAAERDDKSIAEAHRFTAGGVRVVAFEGLQTSDVADKLAGEADLVLGWHYQIEGDRRKMVVSCRSRGGFSALGFAKANGGGGHEQAAGFTVELPGMAPSPDPYTHIESLVRLHVGTRAS